MLNKVCKIYCAPFVCTIQCIQFSVPNSHADTHLLSDGGDTCSTSVTWSYKLQDLEEKGDSMNQLMTRLLVELPRLHWVCCLSLSFCLVRGFSLTFQVLIALFAPSNCHHLSSSLQFITVFWTISRNIHNSFFKAISQKVRKGHRQKIQQFLLLRSLGGGFWPTINFFFVLTKVWPTFSHYVIFLSESDQVLILFLILVLTKSVLKNQTFAKKETNIFFLLWSYHLLVIL